jgi:hydroxymethylbilane synthase
MAGEPIMAPEDALLRVGTRASRLALWQADHVVSELRRHWPALKIEPVPITTLGDRVTTVALSRIGDKGIFTRELEDGLRSGAIDLAVHSLKDLPTELPADLEIGAILEREDPRDALVAALETTMATLPAGAQVGTSSLRRRAQLAAARPDLRIVDIRGNVPTRLEKFRQGEVDAVVLALAGLKRLGLESHVSEVLDPEDLLPAPGQGALAVQIRRGDDRPGRLLAPLDHGPTRLATTTERALLGFLEGGCQVPIGALGQFDGSTLLLRAVVASPDGREVVKRRATGRVVSLQHALDLGEALGRDLLDAGARGILSAIRLEPLSRAALEESAS